LSTNSSETPGAIALKKKEERLRDGQQAMAEYLADKHAMRERTAKRTVFWNEVTIQQFWSGKSFMRPDEGNMLSYELGEDLTRLLSRDYDRFAAFANAARREDAGAAAASGCLGIELGDAAAAILGDGDWQPRPECWHEGVERGQF